MQGTTFPMPTRQTSQPRSKLNKNLRTLHRRGLDDPRLDDLDELMTVAHGLSVEETDAEKVEDALAKAIDAAYRNITRNTVRIWFGLPAVGHRDAPITRGMTSAERNKVAWEYSGKKVKEASFRTHDAERYYKEITNSLNELKRIQAASPVVTPQSIHQDNSANFLRLLVRDANELYCAGLACLATRMYPDLSDSGQPQGDSNAPDDQQPPLLSAYVFRAYMTLFGGLYFSTIDNQRPLSLPSRTQRTLHELCDRLGDVHPHRLTRLTSPKPSEPEFYDDGERFVMRPATERQLYDTHWEPWFDRGFRQNDSSFRSAIGIMTGVGGACLFVLEERVDDEVVVSAQDKALHTSFAWLADFYPTVSNADRANATLSHFYQHAGTVLTENILHSIK